MSATRAEKKKRLFRHVTIGDGSLDAKTLGEWVGDHPEKAVDRFTELVEEKELRLGEGVRDIRRLYKELASREVIVNRTDPNGNVRAVTTSAFPLLTGGLVVAGINDAYMAVPTISQDLVTEIDDMSKSTIFTSILNEDVAKDKVLEGEAYPEIGAGEEFYTIGHKKNGRRLSITQENIAENDTVNIVRRINALGEIAAESVEVQTLRRVCDIDGSDASAAEPYALHLNGTGTQLYNSTANNPGTRAPSGTRVDNNALVDNTDLGNARAVLVAMQNSLGYRVSIPVSRMVLLVPDALLDTAWTILNSSMVPGSENEVAAWGSNGIHRPRLLSSPKLDDLSATAWYLGDFARQFTRKWKRRFDIVTLGEQTESYLQSDIAFQARIGYDNETGATDYVYSVQSLTGTTAPTA